jgi:hypothetical protein
MTMTKSIDTLVEDIYTLLDNGCEPDEENVQRFADNLAKTISQSMLDYTKKREGTLRMSNVGRPCRRQLWYENSGIEGEPIDAQIRLRFLYGHVVEEILLYLAREAGHEVTHEQEEVEVNGIVGHCDAIIDGVMTDVKSASTFAFKKFKEGTLADDDAFGYIPQISGYAKALDCDRAGFLAMDKSSGELTFMEVDQLADIEGIIDEVKAEVNGDKVPDRGYQDVADGKGGNRRLNSICRYCSFKHTCYPDLRMFQYSNGIKYLTHVAKVPQVLELDKS